MKSENSSEYFVMLSLDEGKNEDEDEEAETWFKLSVYFESKSYMELVIHGYRDAGLFTHSQRFI